MKLITSLNWLIFRDTSRIRVESRLDLLAVFIRDKAWLIVHGRETNLSFRVVVIGKKSRNHLSWFLLDKLQHPTCYLVRVSNSDWTTWVISPRRRWWHNAETSTNETPTRETWRKKKKRNYIPLRIDYVSIHDFTDPKGARLLFEREGAWQVRETGWTGERIREKNIVKGTGSNLFHDRLSVIFDPDETGSRTEAPGYIEKRALVPRTRTVRDSRWWWILRGWKLYEGIQRRLQRKRKRERGTGMQRACAAWNWKCTPTRAMPPLNLDLHPRFPTPHGQPGAPNLQNSHPPPATSTKLHRDFESLPEPANHPFRIVPRNICRTYNRSTVSFSFLFLFRTDVTDVDTATLS